MFTEIAENLYYDEKGDVCLVVNPVKNPEKLARKIGLDKLIRRDETVVKIDQGIADFFKRIELERRLFINAYGTGSPTFDASISRFNGDYYIAAKPLTEEEIAEGGIIDKISPGQIVVRYTLGYRIGVAQNEIDDHFLEWLSKNKIFYKSPRARNFCNHILDDLEWK